MLQKRISSRFQRQNAGLQLFGVALTAPETDAPILFADRYQIDLHAGSIPVALDALG